MKRTAMLAVLALVAVVCAAGAVWTAQWSLRFGLAPRAPLGALQTALRFAIVLSAAILLLWRRDPLERITLCSAIVAAGSSAFFGLGLRSQVNDFVRL